MLAWFIITFRQSRVDAFQEDSEQDTLQHSTGSVNQIASKGSTRAKRRSGDSVINQSICWGLSEFESLEPVPIRSPLVIVDVLLPHVTGKTFVQIGTRLADGLSCLQKLGSEGIGPGKVTGIEIKRAFCSVVQERGIEVICKQFLDFRPIDFPLADVYFWWIVADVNKCFLKTLKRLLPSTLHATSQIFIAFDHQYPRDAQAIEKSMKLLKGEHVATVNFREGQGQRQTGKFTLLRFFLNRIQFNRRDKSCESFIRKKLDSNPNTVMETRGEYLAYIKSSDFIHHAVDGVYT